MKINIHLMKEEDIDQIVFAFKKIGWDKPSTLYERYLLEQARHQRSVFIAKTEDIFCGYVTIKWESLYPLFKTQNIPEISDLNVLPAYRNNGIGSQLIATCEQLMKERCYMHAGLGVGMTADYGNAQRLYIQLGYIPDGQGLHYQNKPVSYGKSVVVDDDLVMYLCKALTV